MNAYEDANANTYELEILERNVGLPGRVTVSFTMAGGLLLGGIMVALMTLSGQLSGHGLFMTSTGLFIVGAVIGAVHGSVLGFLGRDPSVTRRDAWAAVGRALMYSVIGAAVAWLITIWVSLTVVAALMERAGPTVLVALAWVGAAAVLSWAAISGLRALQNAYARWPDRVMGTTLVAASFAAFLVTFLADRPEIWLMRLRVTEVGAVLLSGFLTIWVVGPLVTLSLRLVRELPGRDRAVPSTPRDGIRDVGFGLVIGLVAGLLALPFTPSTLVTGTVGGFLVAMSQVLLDETLLRLFLLTGVAWLILRWHRTHEEETAVIAVAAVALAQVMFYLPGILATGFPTTLAAVAFTGAAILLPALLFGAVYWLRGFTAALVADATAAALLLVLVV
ncbi:MAG: hypothetical protein JSU98_03975 [Gemmatimonadales bacterium]|jgi:hypothetical protein|nr:MAG: hypothetical protein JSU98_03975 [Gemmatimonadales bacterium]